MDASLNDTHGTNKKQKRLMNKEPNEVTKLRILQINLNKSITAHLELINDLLAAYWDIILIQEPYITYFNSIRTPNRFTLVMPTLGEMLDATVQSTIWVNSALSTNKWKILDIPNTNDIVAIKLKGDYSWLQIYSIYNAGEHSHSLTMLRRCMQDKQNNQQD